MRKSGRKRRAKSNIPVRSAVKIVGQNLTQALCVVCVTYRWRVKNDILYGTIQSKRKGESMTYFGLTDEVTYLTDEQYLTMARAYWGASPLPKGAQLLGGFSDSRRAGAMWYLSRQDTRQSRAGSG